MLVSSSNKGALIKRTFIFHLNQGETNKPFIYIQMQLTVSCTEMDVGARSDQIAENYLLKI